MKKKIIIGLSILIIAILAGGFWFVQNKEKNNKEVLQEEVTREDNQDQQESDVEEIDTSDWLTYVNEGWGYFIKYPKELYIKDNPQGDKFPGDTSSCPFCGHGGQTLIISDQEKMGIQDIMSNEKIHITITTQKTDSNYRDRKTILEYLESGDKSISRIKLGDLDVYKINPTQNQNNFISMYVINNDWIYHLHGINYTDKNINSENFDLMNAILKTFKFIK